MHTLFVALTLISLLALLWAEFRNEKKWVWIFKPLASTGFVLFALSQGALHSSYGLVVLIALVLGWLGDVLLIPKSTVSFLSGTLSFLLGHLAFGVAFWVLGVDIRWSIASLFLLIPLAVLIGKWILPYVRRSQPEMTGAVYGYIVVISLMVSLAAGAAYSSGQRWILIGAVLFYLSDISVARDRFVAPSFRNKAWGLPFYYVAQLILAWTVGVTTF